MDLDALVFMVRLPIHEALLPFKTEDGCPTLHTDSLANSVVGGITERDGKFYDENGKLIESLPGYAAQRAKWRALATVKSRWKRTSPADRPRPPSIATGGAGIAVGTMPPLQPHAVTSPPRSGIDVRAEIARLEQDACNEHSGVTLRRPLRIGHVLRMAIVEGKSYDYIHKTLGVSKGSVANDVEIGKLYLRMLARKLGKDDK